MCVEVCWSPRIAWGMRGRAVGGMRGRTVGGMRGWWLRLPLAKHKGGVELADFGELGAVGILDTPACAWKTVSNGHLVILHSWILHMGDGLY